MDEDMFSEALVERDEILLSLAQRVERLEQASTTSPSPSPSNPWLPWSRQEHSQEQWAGLADWVDMMVQVHAVTELPSCWLAHEGLVCELDVLRMVWIDAMGARSQGDGGPLASWYQYQWWPLRYRLRELRLCTGGHREEPAPSAADRRFVEHLVDNTSGDRLNPRPDTSEGVGKIS